MMTQAEFIQRAVGLPWERWRSDWHACDCYGLALLYLREVLGIDAGSVPEQSIADGFGSAAGWVETDGGAIGFVSWRDGSPTHCGILLPGGMVLHSEGASGQTSSGVRMNRIHAVERIYGRMRVYDYRPARTRI